MELKRKPNSSVSSVPHPSVQPTQLQRKQSNKPHLASQRQPHDLNAFLSRPTSVQRQAAQPVLQAIALQRTEEQRLAVERHPLQRQAAELSASLPENAIFSALQRQADERKPIAPPAQPKSAGDWVTVMRAFAQQYEQKNAGYGLQPREAAQHTALQRQVAHALVQQVKTSPLPAVQRYAEFAGHAVTLQRHPLTSAIPRAALNFVNVGERPALQRAVDDALKADALQRQQDERALQLHSLQRQLAELDEQATLPVMQRIQERRGAGNPLPAAIQRHLEQGLNHDLSRVRIHDDAEADKLSKAVHATAFTTGTDIYFQSGQFNPNTQSGLELLAHEVTHTVQQSNGMIGKGIDPDSGLEQEAQASGKKLAATFPTGNRPPKRLHLKPKAASTLQRQVAPAAPPDAKAQEAARKLHEAVIQLSVNEPTTGSPATPLLGLENAADLRLGSSRRLVKDEGFWSGPRYQSLGGAEKTLGSVLMTLKQQNLLPAALNEYQKMYGQSFTAVLGERVRDPNTRQRLLASLPEPIDRAQLTFDAFLEQVAVQYVYMNQGAQTLNNMTDDGRRGSNPKDILTTFGYRAGPPISGKWGFQMRVFLPLPGRKDRQPIVAFRGTEGISFDMKGKPEGTLDTVVGDFSPAGVGYNQFQQNRALIERNMKAAASFGKLIITGHSLGGALAQIAAVEYREVSSQVITFQSPGISNQDLKKLQDYNTAHPNAAVTARHYRVDGDVVPTAGQAMLPGQIHYFDRVQRPKGSNDPYKLDLSYDSVDMTRAQAGHTVPMLSTYLRSLNPKDGPLATLAQKGLRDEHTLGKDGVDVGMIYGGAYNTANDPRLQLEPKRTTTLVGAMNLVGQYESAYYDQISYNTILERIEQMAASDQYKTYAEFRAAAQQVIADLSGKGHLPLSPQNSALGKQYKLTKLVKDYEHPFVMPPGLPVYPYKDSPFTTMEKDGVLITQAAGVRVQREIPMIWDAWHPEVKR